MSYDILYTPEFEKEIKRLFKKYPSLKTDLYILLSSLAANPMQGKTLGNHCYKIRLAISSKRTGKSGGARVVTFVRIINKEVVLISIYDKSQQQTISDTEIKARLNKFIGK